MSRDVAGRNLKKTLAVIFGLVGTAGLGFLGIGVLLTGEWAAERSIQVDAPVERVFLHIDSLALWSEWTIWGEVPTSLTGPGRGLGATRSWDDPAYGTGRFTIVESVPSSAVAYRVVVEDGALTIDGRFSLVTDASTTTVTWREEGDFGWNPLLGYVARTMSESQGAELARSLERLRAVVETRP